VPGLTDQNGKPFRNAYGESRSTFDWRPAPLKLERLAPGTWKLDVLAGRAILEREARATFLYAMTWDGVLPRNDSDGSLG
jgi:hypothetical protein